MTLNYVIVSVRLFSVIFVAVSWAALKLYTGKEPPKRHSNPTAPSSSRRNEKEIRVN